MSLVNRLTYDDYLHFPDDGKQRQLIDGEIFVSPSPKRRHQRITLRLAQSLANHLDAHGGGEVLLAPLDVVLSESDVVQPDLLFVATERSYVLTEANVQGAPTIAVEIASPSSTRMDRVLKRDLYGRHGVPEYWIVDPDADRVEVYHLESSEAGHAYGRPELLEAPDLLTSDLLPGWSIPLAELLARP